MRAVSSSTARLAAAPCALLAVALRVLAEARVEPWTYGLDAITGTALFLVLVTLLPALVPLALYLAVVSGPRPWRQPRPASFEVDRKRSRFVAPLWPHSSAAFAIMTMSWTSGALLRVLRDDVPHGHRVSAAVQLAILVAVAAGFLVNGRPRVVLTPAGLTVQRVRSRTVLSWDELAPGGPRAPSAGRVRRLPLYRRFDPGAGSFESAGDLPAEWLHVDPAFLADAVRHYVEHPGHRAAIGAAAELDRLRAALAGPSPALIPA